MLNILKFAKAQMLSLFILEVVLNMLMMDEINSKVRIHFLNGKILNLLSFYCEFNELPYAITYFYNVYGGRENHDGEFATVIAKFFIKKQNKKLQITKPGTQTRNFTHIDDTIAALMLIADKGYGDEYGIANQKKYSITQVAEINIRSN